MLRTLPLIAVLAVGLTAAAPATAAPTTFDASIALVLQNGWRLPVAAPGLARQVHAAGNTAVDEGRSARRSSLAFFAQLTDAQLADEVSPARLELLQRSASIGMWRPQEALGPQTFEQAVRSVNASALSPVADGAGGRAHLGFALYTGDLADNQQRNEIRWGVRILDGGRVDPFSGRRIGPGNRCPGASPAVVRRLNAGVAARRYAGVRRYDPESSRPAYPGLLDRAQRPFVAHGLDVPWYSTRGNHDALAQGFFGARPGARIATGCRMVFPSGHRSGVRGHPWDSMVRRLRRGNFRWVPPIRGGAS